MNTMNKLFELYNEYFDRIEAGNRRLRAKFPTLTKFPNRRKSREEFEDYLMNGTDSELKRSFLIMVLNGHNELYPLLPDCVKKTLANDAA